MAIIANFWSYAKKDNSTSIPSGNNTVTYNVEFIESTSILDPAIRILDTMETDLVKYNYCDITVSSKKRYYKILDWEYTIEGWVAHCHVDVLATYRSQIGSSTQYITRSSYTNDGNIIDNFYQMKTDVSYAKQAITAPWLQAIDAGCYILGVVSPDPQFGSISYYVLPVTSVAILCQYLLTTAISTQNHYTDVEASFALQKSLIDPFQYIKSCIYVPIAYNSITADESFTSLKIWDWSITGCPGKLLSKQHPQYTQNRSFTLAKHPQTSARGNWVNTSPYTRVELQFPPFGTVNLDTSITAANPYITIEYRIDLISGLSAAWIYAAPDSAAASRVLIGNMESMCGIPIQLSQVTRDVLGGGMGLLGAIGSFAVGNIIGGIAGAVGSAAQAMYPHVSTQGSNGSFYQLITEAACYETFYPLIQEDNARFGRPLCGPGQISNYPGYLEVQDFILTVDTMMSSEFAELKQICESGFFYE